MAKFPKFKKVGGGLLALGIFLFLATFGGNDLGAYFAKLKASVFGAIPIITSIYPDSGMVGDLIYLEGQDFGATVEENILKFDDTAAVIASVGLDSSGEMRIIATVPELVAGEYSVTLGTPTGDAFNADDSGIFTVVDATTLADGEIAAAPVTEDDSIDDLIIAEEEGPEPAAPENDSGEIPAEIPAAPVDNESTAESGDFELFAEASPLGVKLSWNYPSAPQFAIFYGGKTGEYLHLLSEQTSPTFLSNLAAGQQYFFQVVARSATGNEIARSAETATIATTGATTGSSEELIHASATPERLSEEGPAETFLIAILLALGLGGILFRRKIATRK
jgi:hypothetical protein